MALQLPAPAERHLPALQRLHPRRHTVPHQARQLHRQADLPDDAAGQVHRLLPVGDQVPALPHGLGRLRPPAPYAGLHAQPAVAVLGGQARVQPHDRQPGLLRDPGRRVRLQLRPRRQRQRGPARGPGHAAGDGRRPRLGAGPPARPASRRLHLLRRQQAGGQPPAQGRRRGPARDGRDVLAVVLRRQRGPALQQRRGPARAPRATSGFHQRSAELRPVRERQLQRAPADRERRPAVRPVPPLPARPGPAG